MEVEGPYGRGVKMKNQYNNSALFLVSLESGLGPLPDNAL